MKLSVTDENGAIRLADRVSLPFGKAIGGKKTFVIAEIGSNHGNDLQRALDTIDAAADIGADAAKFQSLALNKQWHQPSPDIVSLHQKIDLDESWYESLNDRCREKGILFFSSPTYLDAVDLLEAVEVPLYKIASAQIGTFPQLVEKVARTNKPVIISTGIVTIQQLDQVVELFRSCNNNQLAILHCNSIYPTPPEKVSLPRMVDYQQRYDCLTGFSDHTDGTAIAVAAVAMGAKVIEKHLYLDDAIDCPDAPFSVTPATFEKMVMQIRTVENAVVGRSRDILEPEELGFKNRILQKLVLKYPKEKGDGFFANDFHFLRHSQGIDCRELNDVITKFEASCQLEADQLLEWDQLNLVGKGTGG